MSVISKLRVWFGADTTEVEKGFKRVKDKGTELDKGFDKLKSTITAAFSVAAITAFLKECYALAEVQWKAEKRLEAGIKATGKAVGYTAKELKEYASALQQVTLFGDEVTIGAMARLVPYTNITGEVFKQTIALAQDLATVMDTDLNSAVVKLGKALNTPGKGLDELREAGIAFTDTQIKGINDLVAKGDIYNAQMEILNEIYGHVGGAAKDMADDTDNAFAAVTQLKNTWGDFMESIALSPISQGVLKFMVAMIENATEQEKRYARIKAQAEEANKLWATWLSWTDKAVEKQNEVTEVELTAAQLASQMQEDTIEAISAKISAYDKLIATTSILDTESLIYYENEVKRLQEIKTELNSLAETMARVANMRASSGSVSTVSVVDASIDYNRQELLDIANKEIASWSEDLEPVSVKFTADGSSLIDLEHHVENIIISWSQSLGDVISGEFQLESLLKPVADVCQQMGAMLIAYGVGMEAFKNAISNPYAAIAAGAALVAIGAAISNYANNVGEKMTSSSAGGGSSYATQLSDYKDSKVEISGTLIGKGDELVAVINNVNNRNKYTR